MLLVMAAVESTVVVDRVGASLFELQASCTELIRRSDIGINKGLRKFRVNIFPFHREEVNERTCLKYRLRCAELRYFGKHHTFCAKALIAFEKSGFLTYI